MTLFSKYEPLSGTPASLLPWLHGKRVLEFGAGLALPTLTALRWEHHWLFAPTFHTKSL